MPLASLGARSRVDDPDRPQLALVPLLLRVLDSPDHPNRDDALHELCEMSCNAFGEDGTELGATVRAAGGLRTLSWLCVIDTDPEVQSQSLCLLANLASDAVDQRACLSKRELLQCGFPARLLPCLDSQVPEVVTFACAALQSLCNEPEWARALLLYPEAITRLEDLLSYVQHLQQAPRSAQSSDRPTEDDDVIGTRGGVAMPVDMSGEHARLIERYAAGALRNVMGTLESITRLDHLSATSIVSESTMAHVWKRMDDAAAEQMGQAVAARKIQAAWRPQSTSRLVQPQLPQLQQPPPSHHHHQQQQQEIVKPSTRTVPYHERWVHLNLPATSTRTSTSTASAIVPTAADGDCEARPSTTRRHGDEGIVAPGSSGGAHADAALPLVGRSGGRDAKALAEQGQAGTAPRTAQQQTVAPAGSTNHAPHTADGSAAVLVGGASTAATYSKAATTALATAVAAAEAEGDADDGRASPACGRAVHSPADAEHESEQSLIHTARASAASGRGRAQPGRVVHAQEKHEAESDREQSGTARAVSRATTVVDAATESAPATAPPATHVVSGQRVRHSTAGASQLPPSGATSMETMDAPTAAGQCVGAQHDGEQFIGTIDELAALQLQAACQLVPGSGTATPGPDVGAEAKAEGAPASPSLAEQLAAMMAAEEAAQSRESNSPGEAASALPATTATTAAKAAPARASDGLGVDTMSSSNLHAPPATGETPVPTQHPLAPLTAQARADFVTAASSVGQRSDDGAVAMGSTQELGEESAPLSTSSADAHPTRTARAPSESAAGRSAERPQSRVRSAVDARLDQLFGDDDEDDDDVAERSPRQPRGKPLALDSHLDTLFGDEEELRSKLVARSDVHASAYQEALSAGATPASAARSARRAVLQLSSTQQEPSDARDGEQPSSDDDQSSSGRRNLGVLESTQMDANARQRARQARLRAEQARRRR